MIASERIRFILVMLQETGIINLKQVARELHVSEATIRRDFEKLENEGRLKRVPGGAALAELNITGSHKLNDRFQLFENSEAKYKVAESACQDIKSGECIFLDGGTSIAAIVPYISGMEIKIVTNNTYILREADTLEAEVYFIGGKYIKQYRACYGNLSKSIMELFHFDRVFLSCTSLDINANLVYTEKFDALSIKQAALQNCDNSTLLLDSSKINKKSFCRMGNLSDFDRIICDDALQLRDLPDNFILV